MFLFNAGIVDHDVDAAEALGRAVDQPLHVFGFRNVGLYRDGFTVIVRDMFDHRIYRGAISDVIDDDARARRREYERDRLSDSGIAPRDYCHFAAELHGRLRTMKNTAAMAAATDMSVMPPAIAARRASCFSLDMYWNSGSCIAGGAPLRAS